MEATVNVKCPYCGSEQRHLLHVREWPDSASRPEVVLCEPEFGGCDKWFVTSVVTRYEITTAMISSEVEHKTWIPQPEAPAVVVPDWTKAPDWAQWWAADGDGSGNWYECVPAPTAEGDYWENPSGERWKLANDQYVWNGDCWYRSLEQRPQAVQP